MAYEQEGQAGLAVDTAHLQAVVAVLRQHELAEDLSEAVLLQVACEALAGRHLQDSQWLAERLRAGLLVDDDAGSARAVAEAEALLAKSGPSAPGAASAPMPTIAVSMPAVIHCQADLDTVVARHKLWMEAVLGSQWEASEGRANLRGTDLSGLNLEGVNLSCADFSGATLMGTQFSYANLSRCKFLNAKLQGASLRGAKLKKAQFAGADLTEANLEEADLSETDLDDACLTRARFSVSDT